MSLLGLRDGGMTQTQPLVSWGVSKAPPGRGRQTKGRGLRACCGNGRGFMEQVMSTWAGKDEPSGHV